MPLAAQRSLLGWLADHRELLWAVLLALVAGLARGWNMFHFPYYESDEGTYMSQAWALLHLGKLAPYTYWYDHAPGGWVQIALWSLLTGGFYTFGEPVNSGRVLMLLMHLGSVLMVYRIARSLSRSWVAPTIAVLAWTFSAYGAYYEPARAARQHQHLLDAAQHRRAARQAGRAQAGLDQRAGAPSASYRRSSWSSSSRRWPTWSGTPHAGRGACATPQAGWASSARYAQLCCAGAAQEASCSPPSPGWAEPPST